ncbi:LITAF-like zinc ribbon domain-containing protein [Paraphysoderma sedebokerense]|nr:LITAF-like zinc ribbon domain-containing protein [Paraphysoderma sedebokerense]
MQQPQPIWKADSADTLTASFQPQRPTSTFLSVTPIQALNRGPAPVDCPMCGIRGMTTISFETGSATHLWAFGACFCFGLGCLPYFINNAKDVVHKCNHCGTALAIWHRNGGNTELLVHATGKIIA